MNRPNVVVAAGFLLLGLYLLMSSFALPAGMGGLPGPGFFPQVIGAVITALAALLLAQSLRAEDEQALVFENKAAVAGAAGLTFAYLLLWGSADLFK